MSRLFLPSGGAAPTGRERLPWRDLFTSFVIARVVVLSALAIDPVLGLNRRRDSLWQWDAYWYRMIAEHGYDRSPAEGIRFFPAYPLIGRWLSVPFPDGAAIMLVLVANVAAFAYATQAFRLARRYGFSREEATRTMWIVALTPAAFVLVLGYSEALFGLLIAVAFLDMQRRRWHIVAVAGFVAGACRPTGVVLAVPIAIEGLRRWPTATVRERVGIATATLAPVAGLFSYLSWCWAQHGDLLLPLRTQTASRLRGGVLVDPLHTLWTLVGHLVHGRLHAALGLGHVIAIVISLVLLWRCARRLPISATAFSAAMLVLAATTRGFASYERYAESAVPLLIVAAGIDVDRRRKRIALALAVVMLFGLSLAAFSNHYVP